ncbi:MAG: murein biosynthesis integral membrane protein MurJ, partial [Lautropia sp.]|nr:murein biosynthesis integral membrane protein MurJ [Lautropia sp.]
MNLLRAAATISGLTFLSRVTGLIRETLVAATYGAGPMTDAFFVAFRLPNLLRRLFAEGAFTQAFVPMLAETRSDPGRAKAVADSVATILFWTLLLVSLAGILAAPYLVLLVASGLREDAQTFRIAVTLTRWMFPYILLISLVALSAGILNLWRKFAVPAFAPVLLNLSFIFAAVFLSEFFDPPIYALAAGVLIGGIAQLAWQVPALLRIGMLPRIGLSPRRAARDPIVRRILKNMGPAVLAVSVAQFSLIINTQIASHLAPGSVSWISFGDRLMEFPTALLGIAIGTVLLPSLSQAHADDNPAQYSALLDWGLRLCLLLAAPAMVGLALMAEPLVALMFHYGAFSGHDLAMTARTVVAYSAGLFGLIAVKILAPGFFAKQDVRTPMK